MSRASDREHSREVEGAGTGKGARGQTALEENRSLDYYDRIDT